MKPSSWYFLFYFFPSFTMIIYLYIQALLCLREVRRNYSFLAIFLRLIRPGFLKLGCRYFRDNNKVVKPKGKGS